MDENSGRLKLWDYFDDICKIPRPSKKEEQIIQYLIHFASQNSLQYKKDEVGNLLISKAASPGYENHAGVVLQSHVDMVCEKNNDVKHNFETDHIQTYLDGDWLKAKGTTLGADNGIGIAMQLAVLSSKTLKHGPLECLFTVDEETGLTGARALQKGFFTGKILLNLDSEDEGELFIGCAGGIDTTATFRYKDRYVPVGSVAYSVDVRGLAGGHSGDDIDKGRGNAIKIMNRFLWNCTNKFAVFLADFHGGNLRNAIPREASALFTAKRKYSGAIEGYFKQFSKEINAELSITEPNISFQIQKVGLPDKVIKRGTQRKILAAIYSCHNGVYSMSQRMPGMVQTSSNLASIQFQGDNTIEICTSQRSDLQSELSDVATAVRNAFLLADAYIKNTDGYPGWTPKPDSEIAKVSAEVYQKLFHVKPVVRSIHAGLECGLFLEKYPDLDMVSFGPTIKDVHSPDEKLHVPSVKKTWDFVVELLKEI